MSATKSRSIAAVTITVIAMLAIAVPGRATVNHPFASHPMPYASGSILPSHVTAAARDQAVSDFYDAWKARFLKQGCGSGRYYVATATQTGNLTVSEGHGYGMIITALMAGHDANAQLYFDGLFAYFRDHPTATHQHLMSWYQDTSCADAQGNDSASDGDLDVAFALLLADKQWGSCGAINYLAEAQQVIGDLDDGDVDAAMGYTLLGDWVVPGDAQYYPSTRSSDFMVDHFRSYAVASGNGGWSALRDRTYAIVDALQSGYAATTGLLPDFVIDPATAPQPAPSHFLEGANDGRYDYNACRDPWRLATDFLVSGDGRAKTAVQRIETWIRGATGGDPTAIKSGYHLDGTMSSGADYLSMAFVAPIGVGAMVDAANQTWLNDVWDLVVATPITTDGYYENTLKMLALLVMSGNWWAPEAVAGDPCIAPTLTPTVTATPTVTPTPMCPPTPDAGCRTPIAPAAARLDVKDRMPDTKDQLVWRWSKGAATSLTDFGDPTVSTHYDLCVYNGASILLTSALAPAAGTCDGRPCWKARATGFRYASKDRLPSGIQTLVLRAGIDGRARITLKAKGDPLAMPSLPIATFPVTVELHAGATCWSAVYDAAGVRQNDGDGFKARSD